MKIVLNSELVLNETTKDMGSNNSNTTFWLGGEPHLKTMYRRFEVCVNGKVYKVFSGYFGYPTHIGAKLAVAPVARATPLFLPRPEIIYINVVHYSAPPRTYLLRATPLFRPLWRHWIFDYLALL